MSGADGVKEKLTLQQVHSQEYCYHVEELLLGKSNKRSNQPVSHFVLLRSPEGTGEEPSLAATLRQEMRSDANKGKPAKRAHFTKNQMRGM